MARAEVFIVDEANPAGHWVWLLGEAATSTTASGISSTTGVAAATVTEAGVASGISSTVGAASASVTSQDIPSAADFAYGVFGVPYRTDNYGLGSGETGTDPWGAHEILPIRMNTSWNWYHGAMPGYAPSWADRYILPWGQVLIGTGNTATNVRLQARNSRCLYLDSSDVWHDVKSDHDPDVTMEGTFYDNVNFLGMGIANDIRSEAANGGGSSVSLEPLVSTTGPPTALAWHWWHPGWFPRPIVPAGTKAILTAQQVRLIPDDTKAIPDDPSDPDCKFIGSYGADSYGGATETGSGISAFYQPRMVQITDQWVWITGHTFTEFWTNGFGPSPILANAPTAWP